MPYVDGFLLPVQKKNIDRYRRLSRKVGKIYKELGALEFCECVGDDLTNSFALQFPKTVNVKRGETVLFSWIVYKSKAARDRVNDKVMKDPRLAAMAENKDMPFDCTRMNYGGFKMIVNM